MQSTIIRIENQRPNANARRKILSPVSSCGAFGLGCEPWSDSKVDAEFEGKFGGVGGIENAAASALEGVVDVGVLVLPVG